MGCYLHAKHSCETHEINENYTIVLLLKWGYFLLEKDAEQYKGNFIKYGAIN